MSPDANLVPIGTLRKLISHNPDAGSLTWLERDRSWFTGGTRDPQWQANLWNAANAGKPALNSPNHGYLCGKLLGVSLYAHRVMWALYYSHWPDGIIDHINGVPSDNRIGNLRAVDHVENCRNSAKSARNKSGVIGVYQGARQVGRPRPWSACIYDRGERVHLGCFRTKAEAAEARKAAERRFGYHENHGRGQCVP